MLFSCEWLHVDNIAITAPHCLRIIFYDQNAIKIKTLPLHFCQLEGLAHVPQKHVNIRTQVNMILCHAKVTLASQCSAAWINASSMSNINRAFCI